MPEKFGESADTNEFPSLTPEMERAGLEKLKQEYWKLIGLEQRTEKEEGSFRYVKDMIKNLSERFGLDPADRIPDSIKKAHE